MLRVLCSVGLLLLFCLAACDDGDETLRFGGRNGIAFEGDGFDRAGVYCAEYDGTTSLLTDGGDTRHWVRVNLAGRHEDREIKVFVSYYSTTTALEIGVYPTGSTMERSIYIQLSIDDREYRSDLEVDADYGTITFSNVDDRLQCRFTGMLLSMDTPGKIIEVDGSFDVKNERE